MTHVGYKSNYRKKQVICKNKNLQYTSKFGEADGEADGEEV